MINIENLKVKYNDEIIFSNVNLEIPDSSFIVIKGCNGSGKSTLVKSILNINENYTGDIYIDQIKNSSYKDWSCFGYVPQKISLNHDIPINVKEYLSLYIQDKDKYIELVEVFGISKYFDKQINQLSGGQFQLINIVKSMLSNVKYLILDEPDNNLDKSKITLLHNYLLRIKEQGVSIILITHNIDNDFGVDTIFDLDKYNQAKDHHE